MQLCIVYERKNDDEIILYKLAKKYFKKVLLVSLADLCVINNNLYYRNISFRGFDALLFRIQHLSFLYSILRYVNGYTPITEECVITLSNRLVFFDTLKRNGVPIPKYFYCSVKVAKKYLNHISLPFVIRVNDNVMLVKTEKEAKSAIDAVSTVEKFISVEEYSPSMYKVFLLNKKIIFGLKKDKPRKMNKDVRKICEKVIETLKTDFCMIELNKNKQVVDVVISPNIKSITHNKEVHEKLIQHIFTMAEVSQKHLIEKIIDYLCFRT